jgi:uncharacterized protein
MSAQSLPIVTLPPLLAPSTEDWFHGDPAEWHRFDVADRTFLYVADRSRIYEVDRRELERALGESQALAGAKDVLAALGIADTAAVDDQPPDDVPLRSLSLAVAQKCNLACTYCYAQEGDFGGPPRAMPLDVALASVERLFAEAPVGERVHLSFLGGEPLLARDVLRAATLRAVALAEARGVRVGLSITTNGTLVTSDDADFFARHGFAVTLSLDGVGAVHDRLRPFKGGGGSFDRVLANLRPLLQRQGKVQLSARVTVTPRNLDLKETLDTLIDMGFHSVGFSPMLASPTGRDEMSDESLTTMLERMIACGREFERRAAAGQRYPFSNMAQAMRELHRGTHRPYPCGAGAGYFGVSAEGQLFACHRFVDDPSAMLGSVGLGVDRERQANWLRERHVHRQQPCRSCWARYLCGGGCHHEVLHRGRPACDYIRGWLHFCLGAYVRLSAARPDYFGPAND